MTDVHEVFSDLVRLETQLWNGLDARLRAELGLPLSHYEPLRVIERRRRCRVQDIAEDLAITVGGTSKLVDRLETAGHCRRRANPADGRSSIVELTPVGRRLLGKAEAVVLDELTARLTDVLPARVLAQLATSLTTLRASERTTT